MYLITTFTEKKDIREPFFGVHFSDEEVEHADRCELWGSSFSDPGGDFCEYRLMKEDRVIARRRTIGY